MTSPLRHLIPTEVDAKARAESRNREVHLPPISVFRWWARRTEAVNGAILDAVAKDRSGRLVVADIFAGGGIIPLAAAIRKHFIYAQDLNPWAAHGLQSMFCLPRCGELSEAAEAIRKKLQPLLLDAYGTELSTGEKGTIAHTFRVATAACPACSASLNLFPHAMVSLKHRKERSEGDAFIACRRGHVFEATATQPSICPTCGLRTDPSESYTVRRIVTCHTCGQRSSLSNLANSGTWGWKVVLVERSAGRKRELSVPRIVEVAQATDGWTSERRLAAIPEGRETAVLRRHGFEYWHDLYPARQRHVLECLLKEIGASKLSRDLANAMELAALGVAEMAGLASRWDRWYLKSYETMASHRFNFTTLAVEPNVWGTSVSGRGTFRRRVAAFGKASMWLKERTGKLKVARRKSSSKRTAAGPSTDVVIVEGSSERIALPNGTVDVVLTDPPYHDDVQYGQLSLPLRAWANLPMNNLDSEAVACDTGEESYDSYRQLLARIFTEAHRTLRLDGRLIFSYANREPDAWVAVLRALHEAGFKAAGYAIVHSENETDHAKRNVRACTMDLLLDMVSSSTPIRQWRPAAVPTNAEGAFLRLVGETLLNSVGLDENGWVAGFRAAASSHPFIVKA